MELREFNYVNMVAECGSITKAAAKLFITQPALSNYINKVEEELGAKLFDRSSNPLVLTYAGEQYLKRSQKIMNQLADMEREMRDITGHMTGRIRLGFPSERIIYMLPLILGPFQKQYPGIRVDVLTGPGNRLIEYLRSGDVDFIFLPTWHELKDIVQVNVYQEELVLVAQKGYLQDKDFIDRDLKVINWREAAKYPLITLKKGHALRGCVEVLYKSAGVKPNIYLESHSNMLSYRLASQGLGVAVIPEITMKNVQGVQEAEVFHLSETPVTWEVFALYRDGFYLGEAERALLEIAQRELQAGTDAHQDI